MTPPATAAAGSDAVTLAGHVAVVTGASSGIGRATALRLAAAGATVLALGRDQARLDDVAKQATGPGDLVPVRLDLTDDEARTTFAAEVLARHGRVDHLVHSAGAYGSARVDDATIADLDAQYAANVRAPYALTQGLLPALRVAGADGGADIVVVNSTQGVRAGAGTSQFAATQHAMRGFADSLRQEINADGVRVATIHLGRTATPRQETIYAREGRAYAPELLIQADDVAGLIAYLLHLPATAEVTELHLRPAKKSY
ncbi:Short-chain alcohol dehydrogenase [Frankia canadensis]|uniref:Short-chain alcohol dehydrogenase n=1 Tax=Frankia canadensis TaxID=1836972 RepID=A0A2I2L022_9ACTN|nr:SDR family NAD(P)-dependent oxidoreductase [Frankia canadensis]SNQ51272.1 Short-chain alcohol dehydrogenase [Frankia canadensis]SOU58562.1 Short-chain alcohol dehydrogenase [Frankia canadensis]